LHEFFSYFQGRQITMGFHPAPGIRRQSHQVVLDPALRGHELALPATLMNRCFMASVMSATATLQGMLFHLPSVMGFLLVMSGSAVRMVLLKRRVGLLQMMMRGHKMLGHCFIPFGFRA
jgi:hypothetical protein